MLKEISTIQVKKSELPHETGQRKSSNPTLSKMQILELKKANLVNLNLAKNFKSGFNKRLLSKLGCHLIIKLISTENVFEVVKKEE